MRIPKFTNTICRDPDLNVRRLALVAFNSAAHNKPSLIRDPLREVLPQLYNETQKRKELIRVVEMGPFKHEVDYYYFQNFSIRFAGGRRSGPAQGRLRMHVHAAVHLRRPPLRH